MTAKEIYDLEVEYCELSAKRDYKYPKRWKEISKELEVRDKIIKDAILERGIGLYVGKYFKHKRDKFFYFAPKSFNGYLLKGIRVGRDKDSPIDLNGVDAYNDMCDYKEVTKGEMLAAYDRECALFREKLNNL